MQPEEDRNDVWRPQSAEGKALAVFIGLLGTGALIVMWLNDGAPLGLGPIFADLVLPIGLTAALIHQTLGGGRR